MDNRELHAMLFSALHLPPLPVVVDIVDKVHIRDGVGLGLFKFQIAGGRGSSNYRRSPSANIH